MMDGEGQTVRIIIFTQGEYGKRILDNIKMRAPANWIIRHQSLPQDLPILIEEPEEIVERFGLRGNWDLVLYLGENSSSFSLLPTILEFINATAVIAPVDNYEWLPRGLEKQIQDEIRDLGVEIVFPRTFCTLAPIGVKSIDEFSAYFGAPILQITLKDGKIDYVNVKRGAPCGSTHFMAEKLKGISIDKAGTRAGTLIQIFPCLASRKVDRHFGDAAIHIAGYIAKRSVEKAITY